MHAPTPSSKPCNQSIRMPDPTADDPLVPILQRRAWKRLGAAIVTYERELLGRSELVSDLECASSAIQELLKTAKAACNAGDIDRGWKLLLAAQRLELLA